ncbi:WYL domain-containing protein [Paenibacillus oryzisoli]|uniref:WYL domain-containing protein n=1 Tax=Paenibacillus oryzisoli TaxID=1850517 RepID=UPI003D2E1FB9
MHLFEKIFNHQILSRLEDSGTFMITSHERSWLKTMLAHPAAAGAFTEETLHKLRVLLASDAELDISRHFVEKAASLEKQVYHPLLRVLRRLILRKSGIRLSFEIKNGTVKIDQSGVAYKLEYSMVKREWYLLWYNTRHNAFMSTKVKNILAVTEEAVESPVVDRVWEKIEKTLASRRSEALIEVVPLYNRELSRILYAFSSFEKKVEYDVDRDTYRVRVTLLGDEAQYLLSKLRFLGMRVRVVEGDYLKHRMLESSTKALARYGVSDEEELLG